MIREIKVLGLAELEKKLDGDFLVQPEIDDAFASFGKRMERGGKGLGAQRNTIAIQQSALAVSARTTLNSPRMTGASWSRKNIAIIKAMASSVFRKAAERMKARFDS